MLNSRKNSYWDKMDDRIHFQICLNVLKLKLTPLESDWLLNGLKIKFRYQILYSKTSAEFFFPGDLMRSLSVHPDCEKVKNL